jgi:hypothetical protein
MTATEKVFENASWIDSLKRQFFGKSVPSREKIILRSFDKTSPKFVSNRQASEPNF